MAVAYFVFSEGNYRILCLSGDAKPSADNGITLVETDTGKFYLRTGGAWVEQANNIYATAAQGALAASALQPAGNGGSLTGLTKAQVGLANVDNTSDAAKPISTATQTALDAKQATLVSATNIKTINGSTVLGSGDLVVSGTQPDIPLTKIAPATSQTITAGYSAYVCGPYEIVTATSLEIGVGSCLEIG